MPPTYMGPPATQMPFGASGDIQSYQIPGGFQTQTTYPGLGGQGGFPGMGGPMPDFNALLAFKQQQAMQQAEMQRQAFAAQQRQADLARRQMEFELQNAQRNAAWQRHDRQKTLGQSIPTPDSVNPREDEFTRRMKSAQLSLAEAATRPMPLKFVQWGQTGGYMPDTEKLPIGLLPQSAQLR